MALAACGVGIATLGIAHVVLAYRTEITVGNVQISEHGIAIMEGTERVLLTPQSIQVNSNAKGGVVLMPGELVVYAPEHASIRLRTWSEDSTAAAMIDAGVTKPTLDHSREVLGQFSAGAVNRMAAMKVESGDGTEHRFIAEPKR